MNLRKTKILFIFQPGCGDGTLVTNFESISNTKGVVPEERANHELHQSQQTTVGDAQASGMLNTYHKLSLSSPRNIRETFRQALKNAYEAIPPSKMRVYLTLTTFEQTFSSKSCVKVIVKDAFYRRLR
jgi:hypothetical protein